MADSPFPSPYPQEPEPTKVPAKPFVFPNETPVEPTKPAEFFQPVAPIEMPAPQEYNIPESPDEDEEVKNAIRKSCVIVTVIAVALFIVGNTVWNLSLNKKTAQADGYVWFANEKGSDDKSLISAANGGTVSLGKAQVIIPPGALATDQKIEIEKVKDGDVTDLYYLKPHGLKFLKRVTVVLPYKEAGLKGASPYSIELDYWPKEQVGDPRAIGYTVNEKDQTLQTHVSEF